MKVLKFGGTSVGSPEVIRQVRKIIEQRQEPNVVVVSAFGGVTDAIIRIANMAAQRDETYTSEFQALKKRHLDAVNELIEQKQRKQVLEDVENLLSRFESMLKGVYLLEDLSLLTMDYIFSFGERLSAKIIAAFIPDATYLDSRELIRTDSEFSCANVDFATTEKQVQEKLVDLKKVAILPGFIATDAQGKTTTLGRGGSDYSAAIYAAALNASSLEIWTDVDGFMTADPRIVKKAYPIDCLTYEEAMELSHFGAKVIYTPTLIPVIRQNIPIRIKNTFRPEAPGTIITNKGGCSSDHLIKGISSVEKIDLITVKGAGMVGKTGTSSRVFSSLAVKGVNVVLITQASSEMTISFAVSPGDTRAAVEALGEEFEKEIDLRHEMEIEVIEELSIISIVGEAMRHTPGISAIFYQALGHNGISAIATAQGSSELNISVVIERKSLTKALNSINEGFFLSDMKEIHLYMAGTGTVGKILLEQIKQQQKVLQETHRVKINLVGITNSRKMVVETDGIDPGKAIELLENGDSSKKPLQVEKADMDEFIGLIKQNNLRNSLFVDCTANEAIAGRYLQLFSNYVSVITANKIACSSGMELYRELKKTALQHNVAFIFETNVGAGLPIISTIEGLIGSGDRIHKIEAVISGTLNYILNLLSDNIPFSKAIRMAMENGYSEPDPRLDLSGTDVKRKLLILARESGYEMEEEDIRIKPFIPDELFEGDVEQFLKKAESLDSDWESRLKKVAEAGKTWRYIARLEDGKGVIGLEEVERNHPAFRLDSSNNIILLTTDRYNDLPLLIQGHGAGAEVTAAGVFADIIRQSRGS